MGKFVIKESSAGFTFRLKAQNGEVIAVSEVYKSLDGCENGIESVKQNAVAAGVEDLTGDGGKVSNPKFEIYKDNGGDFRFRLKARNGEIIATSEGYNSKSGCKNGIESVRENAPSAQTVKE